MAVMRWTALALLACLAGCPVSVGRENASGENPDDSTGSGDNTGGGEGAPVECLRDIDCVGAGPKCCDCPTHALPASDPAAMACADVECAPTECGSPMQAVCDSSRRCVLACSAVACDASVSCSSGYATDANGCLTCECRGSADVAQCNVDSDCVRVRDDCCGCAAGGGDTAVPTGDAAAHDAALMCPAVPTCPGADACSPDLAARCVQGACELVDGTLPAGACGRADLAPCDQGESCYVNADVQATMYGVGVCQP
jgi:hypothetical protein